ncbi:PH domain-containing protein [Patescibacteria group bacterium]|nr:PH domain-containing protein [Patescibacteria group bacterium]
MPDVFVAKEEKTKPAKVISSKLENELELGKAKAWGRELRFLSSVAFEPARLSFEGQDPDEKIIIFIRPHLITNLKWFLLVVLLALIPLFAFSLLSFGFVPVSFRFIGLLIWYLLTFAFAFERFLVWFFNVEIITNKRIIDVNIPNILFRDITQTPLEKIQDVTAETAGFMRSLLAFGDVRVQTAGAIPEIKFEAVPNPNKVSQILNDLWRKI